MEKSKSKWQKDKAWCWYNDQPWLCGYNFLTSIAVNSTKMWQMDTFYFNTIDKELGWAEQYDYNSCRVFLQFLVWQEDREGYKERIDHFLEIANNMEYLL
jgi:hypothetical protein